MSITADDIERLAPLWRTVHEHHRQVAPQLGPYVDAADSWRIRRETYRTCLEGSGFAFIATEAGIDVGYALVAVGGSDTTWSDTWVVAAPVAELETLGVVPAARGRGIGGQLLDAVDAELERRAITDMVIGAVVGNEDAIRLYERRGFRRTWTVLSRFSAHPQG